MKNLILAFLVAFQLLSCNSKQKEETPEHSANAVDNDTTNDERLGNDPDGTIYVLNYDKPQSEQIFYGYSADNPDKIFLLNSKREKIKSKLDYSLSLNEY